MKGAWLGVHHKLEEILKLIDRNDSKMITPMVRGEIERLKDDIEGAIQELNQAPVIGQFCYYVSGYGSNSRKRGYVKQLFDEGYTISLANSSTDVEIIYEDRKDFSVLFPRVNKKPIMAKRTLFSRIAEPKKGRFDLHWSWYILYGFLLLFLWIMMANFYS